MKTRNIIAIITAVLLMVVLIIVMKFPHLHGAIAVIGCIILIWMPKTTLIPGFKYLQEGESKANSYNLANYVKSYFIGYKYCAQQCNQVLFLISTVMLTFATNNIVVLMLRNGIKNTALSIILVLLSTAIINAGSIWLIYMNEEDTLDMATGVASLALSVISAIASIVLPEIPRLLWTQLSVWVIIIATTLSWILDTINITTFLGIHAPFAFFPIIGAASLGNQMRDTAIYDDEYGLF